MKRRCFIKHTAIAGATAIASSKAPYVFARNKYRLRVLGTHVTLQEELRLHAERDLGIELVFSPGGSSQVMHQAATRPQSFDLYEQWSDSINILWRAGTIKPIQTSRITYWDKVNGLAKYGQLNASAKIGAGDAPNKILWVQKDGKLGTGETKEISFLPYVHNTDSIGYNSAHIKKGIPYETESWGWLLEEGYSGKVAIVNAPTIGIFDLALAAKAKGFMDFKNIGNMTKIEIDQLFRIIIKYKKRGHFRGVWSSVSQSVHFMEQEGVLVESMFSPGVSELNGKGIPCVYAAPREGYRAWHGVMCLSSHINKINEDAAYEYMNWWLSGWPGAFIAKQGYYISTPQLSKQYLSQDEWAYWYAGESTTVDLENTSGKIAIKKGSVRTGGSYEKRFSNVAVWNTVMETYEYSLYKWREFLLS